MSENKTHPTVVAVQDFLHTVSEKRQAESRILIELMSKITGDEPVMWGPSIIGFGSQHYKYDSGREGDMPSLGFSPRKAAITFYFSEGFEHHDLSLKKLGKYKASVSCLYVSKIDDIDLEFLNKMLVKSYLLVTDTVNKPQTVEDYIKLVPKSAKLHFDKLRTIVQSVIPEANEVLSYGIVGYKIDDKRARVFISGWKDHIAIYPIPKEVGLRKELEPYIKGKGTLWFSLEKTLPTSLIKRTVKSLVK